MRLQVRDKIYGSQVHYADYALCVRSSKLTTSVNNGDGWLTVGHIPTHTCRRLALSLPILSRLLRGGIHAIIPFAERKSLIVVAESSIFTLSLASHQIKLLHKIKRGRHPLRRGLCIINGYLYFGEYWSNPERKAVHIIKIQIATGEQEILYTFPVGSARHIHTVDHDPYSQKLWISTGDSDNESHLLLLDIVTGQVEKIGQNSQKWRAVSFAFLPDAVYWGTDNHKGKNNIWRYERSGGTISKVGNITGPVYYNVVLEGGIIIMGTTMEKGEGQQDGYGRLYSVSRFDNIQELWRMRKDFWSAKWFGYGVFEFAEGSMPDNQFWVTAKGYEGGLCSILFEVTHV